MHFLENVAKSYVAAHPAPTPHLRGIPDPPPDLKYLEMHNFITFLSFFLFHSPVLIDAVVAAQTTPGQDAMMEFLDFNEENDITLPERYLLAAAFSTHPSYKLLHDLLVCED